MTAKRKTKKHSKKRRVSRILSRQEKELIGLFLVVIGILSFVSVFSPNMGMLGRGISSVLIFLTGKGKILIPINMIFIGLLFIQHETGFSKKKIIFLILWVSFCILLFLDRPVNQENLGFSEKIGKIQIPEVLTESGGIIGGIFGYLFYQLLGSTGTLLTLIIITVAYLSYLLPYSQGQIREVLRNLFKNLQNKRTKGNEMGKKRPHVKKKEEKESKKDSFFEEKQDREITIIDYAKEDPAFANPTIEEPLSFLPKEEGIEQPQKAEPLSRNEKEAFRGELREDVRRDYVFPPVELLNLPKKSGNLSRDTIKENGRKIEETMKNFGIDCRIIAINRGPVITCYELEPAPGVRLNKIVSLADNLSLTLASSDIRIEAPIPGKSAVGIEVPNPVKDPVGYREIVESEEFKNATNTPLALGKDVSGKIITSSIDKMPHLLIAGATGSGKSVCINTILAGILYKAKPEEVRLILIDPKVVELSVYNGIPHLLIPVVTDPKKAAFALNWAVEEMEKRYQLFAKNSVRDMSSYNGKMRKNGLFEDVLPKIIIVVDELSDLMMVAAGEVEDYIARLAQMARAAGIYLIIATQRPSVDVITGTIKANIPSRIAFAVSSAVDSRTILDMGGAEKLLGKGDMLFYPSFYSKPKRIQGAFISDGEVEEIVRFIRMNSGEERYDEKVVERIEEKKDLSVNPGDPLTEEAIRIVIREDQASISFLQRKLKVGYSRAARIIDEMEEMGIIGPHEGSKPRKLLLSEEEKEKILEVENE